MQYMDQISVLLNQMNENSSRNDTLSSKVKLSASSSIFFMVLLLLFNTNKHSISQPPLGQGYNAHTYKHANTYINTNTYTCTHAHIYTHTHTRNAFTVNLSRQHQV